jgi:hypothetical protein
MNFMLGQEFRFDLVVLYYSVLLHRTASAPEIDGWVSSLLNASQIRVMFESTPEFFTNG